MKIILSDIVALVTATENYISNVEFSTRQGPLREKKNLNSSGSSDRELFKKPFAFEELDDTLTLKK